MYILRQLISSFTSASASHQISKSGRFSSSARRSVLLSLMIAGGALGSIYGVSAGSGTQFGTALSQKLATLREAVSSGRLTRASKTVPAMVPAGTITGKVFHDYNANGLRDTTTTINNNGAGTTGVAIDAGVMGVQVTAYDTGGAAVGTAVTVADGSYSLAVSGNGPYRIEFTSIPVTFQPGPVGSGADGSGTTVQFVSDPNAANVNLGLVCADQYCQNDPIIATSCFVFGDAVNGPNANQPAIVGFAYDAVGASPNPLHIADTNQVGPTFGLAWQRSSGSLFASAFMKRHTGFGPGGTGAIYRIANPLSATPTVSLFLDFNALLGAGTTGADPHPAGTDFFHDSNSFDAVGKAALGGLRFSEDEQTLYTVNLATRELYKIPIGNPPTAPVSAAAITRVAVPATLACSSPNDVRPFGLGVNKGRVYVGTVCSAQSSQNASDLRAAVYEFDPATNTFNATPVLDFPLNYPRGKAFITNNISGQWRPWKNTFNPEPGIPCAQQGALCLVADPQPILSDIAFDGQAMLIGLRDRFGDQSGRANATDPNDPTLYFGVSAGDILRAAPNGSGGWAIESNAVSGGPATGGAGNGQGPGGGEYYFEDNFTGLHDEVGLGSQIQLPGFPDLIVTVFDPIDQVYEGGVRWFRNNSGTKTKSYRIYGDSSSTFGKANGLGSLAALCNSALVELGNRVWFDQNSNGIQDAGEPGIANVAVQIYDNQGNHLGTTTTDSDGLYYFNDSNVSGGLKPDTRYRLLLDQTQAVIAGRILTSTQAGANRAIDSDGVLSGFAVIDLTSPPAGTSDHTYDFGFTPALDLSITKTDNRTNYAPGGAVTYAIVVTNNGPADVTNAIVTDVLPAAVASASWNCAITASGTGTVINACGAASGTGSINTTVTLRVGASATFTMQANIKADATGQLVNTATVAAPAGVVETNLANNSATDIDTASPEADLAIAKTTSTSTYVPGNTLTYTIVVTNNGPSDVTNATVTDNLPAGLTNVSWSCGITAAGTGAVVNACGAANGTGNINTTVTLRRGAAATFTVTTTTGSGATGNITNTATVTAPPGVTETNLNNNSATVTNTPTLQSDIAITKTDGVTTYVPGNSLTYTIVVTNNGPSDVTNATVTDNLPAGIAGATWTCGITAAGTGTVTNACGAASGNGNINTTVTLRRGAAATFTLNASVASGASGNLTNTATVAPPAGVTDTNPNNNSATDTDIADPQVDLAITKTDGQINYTPGDQLIYRITVTNGGPGDVVNAVVNDNLPPNIASATWTCAITAAGTGSVINACGAASGTGNINTTLTLRNGAVATFTLRARVSDRATGALTNTVTVAPPAGVTDVNPANNTASDTDARLLPPPAGGSGDEGNAGSVLIYPIYTSSPSNPSNQNTRINLTNTNEDRTACVHLFFVDGSNCSVADSFVCLTPNQTLTVQASDFDPGVTGYLIAVAVDCVNGCPVKFNYLIGDLYTKFSSGHAANLKAHEVRVLQPAADFERVCMSDDLTATLKFDGTVYEALPRVLAADNLASPVDGNSALLILDRINGDLSTSLNSIGSAFGMLFDDLESPFSFSFSGGCQFRNTLSSSFPRTTPRLNQIIPAGHGGWLKLWATGSASDPEPAIIGATINFNPNAGSNPEAYNQGHSLHTLTLTQKATLVMPVFPPTC